MAWAQDRAIGTVIAALAVTLLAACQQSSAWRAGDRTFATTEAALAYTRDVTDSRIATIEPLSAPLAPSLVAITPTREHAKRVLLEASPSLSGETLDYLVEAAIINWSLPPRQIERRGIFETVRFVSSDNVREVDVEARAYRFWMEVPHKNAWSYHIGKPGSGQLTEIVNSKQLTRDAGADIRTFLSAIESFVHATAQ
ncbi:MAG: hypothetical protein MI806_21265 [Minwuiales bacterium]|nr:hypothetical protein [Minwuiales bacterium]